MNNPQENGNAEHDFGPLTLQQAENLADFASKRAEERLYARIGRSVVAKLLYTLGAGCIALASYLAGGGKLH